MGPAAGAKIVTTVVLGAVGAGVFAGVSHDGRGAEPVQTESVVPTTSTTPSTTTTIFAAAPATPDPMPTRARVRSGGS